MGTRAPPIPVEPPLPPRLLVLCVRFDTRLCTRGGTGRVLQGCLPGERRRSERDRGCGSGPCSVRPPGRPARLQVAELRGARSTREPFPVGDAMYHASCPPSINARCAPGGGEQSRAAGSACECPRACSCWLHRDGPLSARPIPNQPGAGAARDPPRRRRFAARRHCRRWRTKTGPFDIRPRGRALGGYAFIAQAGPRAGLVRLCRRQIPSSRTAVVDAEAGTRSS